MQLELIKNNLLDTFQIDIDVSNDNNDCIILRLTEFEPNKGFYINIERGWKRIDAKIVFEDFSRKFVNSLSNPSEEKIRSFISIFNNSEKNGFSLNVIINKTTSKDIRELLKADSEWTEFEIEIAKPYIEDNAAMSEALVCLSEDMLGLMLSLMTLVEINEPLLDIYTLGLPEGAKEKITVNKYERNRINRKCCLDFYGYECKVCTFNFEKNYGVLGKKYIHVHHITPVSELGTDYIINPVNDLIPVCPNCHSMLHKNNPPFTVDELKDIIKNET